MRDSAPIKITSPTLHGTIFFTMAVFVAIIVMSFVFQVEVVARGEGRVVPVGRVQVVQPEAPGRITAIHVRNGSPVRQGDVLIELDPTNVITELGTLTAERDRLLIDAARINALDATLDPERWRVATEQAALDRFDPPDGLEAHPYAAEQRQILRAQVASFLATQAQIDARDEANRRSEKVTLANIDMVDAGLEVQSERMETTQRLFDQGTASRASFLDVRQSFAELERQREVYLRELDLKQAERTSLETERRRFLSETRGAMLAERAEIDARLAAIAEQERAVRRRVAAATLRAPVSGIVDQLQVFTVGGVADLGQELMRIVPSEAEVEVEARFPNQDIGFVEVGQRANIRLDAYPSERFGFVTGRVADLAADSTEGENGEWRYVVRVTPDASYLVAGEDRFSLRPGMTATIDITTDRRRIISYFFAPILRTVQDAMGER